MKLLTGLIAAWILFPIASASGDEQFFENRVAPILQRHCLNCHNAQDKQGDLSLADMASVEESGFVEPGDPDSSHLIDQITSEAGKAEMPKGKTPLSEAEVSAIRKWIEDGAHWPEGLTLNASEWWSLRPLVSPALPTEVDGKPIQAKGWARSPIDIFIAAKLQQHGLSPAKEADRQTLIRRLYYDLVGLPPSPESVEKFVADPDPKAYEKLVDELLESPRYGERWARHWLDVVHYGETHGYDKDKPRLNAWPYRDYVIRSFNQDKRYTRFVQEQIAGDVMFPGTVDGIEALGFIAAGPWDHVGHAEVPETKIDGKVARHLDRDDMVRNTMQTFMSLTVGCAQCHDHKFDPIPTEDYYSLQSVFSALDRADQQYYDDPKLTIHRQNLRARGRILLSNEYKYKKAIKALEDGEAKTAKQKELDKDLAELKGIRAQLAKMPEPKTAYIGTVHYGGGTFIGTGHTGGRPRPIHVLPRGDVTNPGKKVVPGALSCVEGMPSTFQVDEDAPEGDRRKALATWLTDPHNPLPWRSIVNRVWLYHFGRGLVDTPSDFGRMGGEPSHQMLLDYLAADFRDGDQSIKQLHRKIVTSATYQQSSSADPKVAAAAREVDSENRFYWRNNRRQLEAEAIRDAVLQVSGKLDMKMGGPSFQDFVIDKPEHSPHYEYFRHDPEDVKSHRRSVYRFLVRSQTQPFMTVMDCADPSMLVSKRNSTISPLQSLALLNNQLMVVMAKHFASRVEAVGSDPREQVTEAFRLAMSRSPTESEVTALTKYAAKHGMPNTCRVILNLNEFIFVD